MDASIVTDDDKQEECQEAEVKSNDAYKSMLTEGQKNLPPQDPLFWCRFSLLPSDILLESDFLFCLRQW